MTVSNADTGLDKALGYLSIALQLPLALALFVGISNAAGYTAVPTLYLRATILTGGIGWVLEILADRSILGIHTSPWDTLFWFVECAGLFLIFAAAMSPNHFMTLFLPGTTLLTIGCLIILSMDVKWNTDEIVGDTAYSVPDDPTDLLDGDDGE